MVYSIYNRQKIRKSIIGKFWSIIDSGLVRNVSTDQRGFTPITSILPSGPLSKPIQMINYLVLTLTRWEQIV